MPRKRLASEPLELLGVMLPASQKRRLFQLAGERRTTASEMVRKALDALAVEAA